MQQLRLCLTNPGLPDRGHFGLIATPEIKKDLVSASVSSLEL
jgi:hypothetical protein